MRVRQTVLPRMLLLSRGSVGRIRIDPVCPSLSACNSALLFRTLVVHVIDLVESDCMVFGQT